MSEPKIHPEPVKQPQAVTARQAVQVKKPEKQPDLSAAVSDKSEDRSGINPFLSAAMSDKIDVPTTGPRQAVPIQHLKKKPDLEAAVVSKSKNPCRHNPCLSADVSDKHQSPSNGEDPRLVQILAAAEREGLPIQPRLMLRNGLLFRSRLEARWAAFFDLLGWPWEYEPFDLNGYTPDFLLKFKVPPLVEVTPEVQLQNLQFYQHQIETSGWNKEYLIVGAALFAGSAMVGVPCLGLLGEKTSSDSWWADQGLLFRCKLCGQISLMHGYGSYSCRRNLCHDGDHHISSVNVSEIQYFWNRSYTQIRWID
jgi:hypothetical protein